MKGRGNLAKHTPDINKSNDSLEEDSLEKVAGVETKSSSVEGSGYSPDKEQNSLEKGIHFPQEITILEVQAA